MSQPRILMCPPDHYGIEYEINPWMSRSRGSDSEKAHAQWQRLYETLLDFGVEVEKMEPRQGLPDLVFTANAGLVYENRFFTSRFRHEVRKREEPYFDEWFAAHGFAINKLPKGTYFEGAGDALFCDEQLFAGYRIRSDVRGHQHLGTALGVPVLPVELVDERFYHLDTCFCPLATNEAIWFPGAFDKYGRTVIESNVTNLIAAEESDAQRFGCNAVVVGKKVIVNAGCDRLAEALTSRGYEPTMVALDEFIKAGGSAKCLTLRLDGEDAATWKQT